MNLLSRASFIARNSQIILALLLVLFYATPPAEAGTPKRIGLALVAVPFAVVGLTSVVIYVVAKAAVVGCTIVCDDMANKIIVDRSLQDEKERLADEAKADAEKKVEAGNVEEDPKK